MSDPGRGEPAEEARPPAPEARRDDEAVEIASEDSFPASDPPATTPSHIGAPLRRPPKPAADDVAPKARPDAPATEGEAHEERARDPERAETAGREG